MSTLQMPSIRPASHALRLPVARAAQLSLARSVMCTESERDDIAMSDDDPKVAVYTVILPTWEAAQAFKTTAAEELLRVGFERFEHSTPWKLPGDAIGYAVFFVVPVAAR